MTNAPDNLADLRRDLGRALSIMAARAPEYVLGKEYYDGTRREVSASPTIVALIEKNAEAAPISLAHIPVEVIADKVKLASLTAAEAPAADALETVIDENDLEDEADDIITKACYFGDYYVIVDPTAEDDEGKITADGILVVGSSPLTTVVVYDSKTGREALFGAKVWAPNARKGEEHWKALLYYNDATVKLITPLGKADKKAEDFELDIAPDDDEREAWIEHPGDRILVEHLAVGGKPYGIPVHRKAWGPQDAITKISATNLNNVDGQGFASRWALADPLAEIDDDIDDDFGDASPVTVEGSPSADGMTTATTGKSRVRSVPGAISILRGIKQVGQFENEDSDNFLKNLDWYVRVMAVACGVALFEFDLTGEQPSGESRRRAESRSNTKAEKVQRAASAFFRGIGDTVLALLGTPGTVQATFKPTETATDKEGIELVALKIKSGVPITQALLEAGYTDEQVHEWYPDGEPHITPDYLSILATALAQLGQAKTLGVITDAELSDMLPDILTAARPEVAPVADDADELPTLDVAEDVAGDLKAQAEALGQLIRAGADPEQAAAKVGLAGLEFPNVPVTVRIPEDEASNLEGAGAPAPAPGS